MQQLTICQEIVSLGCNLVQKGLISGTWGNISARIPATQYIAITPSGYPYHLLNASHIVIVDLEGKVVQGSLKPSSELPLHLSVYQARTDISAIVHTHSVFASACAVARKPIPAIIEDLIQINGGSVNVAEYALPGTEQLAYHTAKALGNRQSVLLANHGMIGCGRNLTEAMMVCELVEKAAQIFIHSQQLGGAHILSDNDISIMYSFYLEHYRRRQGGELDV